MSTLLCSVRLAIDMGYPIDTTLIVKTSAKSDSLRTTIPRWAVRQLGLVAGQKIRWELKADGDSLKLIATPITEVES